MHTNNQRIILKTLFVGIACVFCLALACVLSGCNSVTPTQTAEKFLEAIKTDDASLAEGIYDGEATFQGAMASVESLESDSDDASDDSSGELSQEAQDLLAEKLKSFEYTVGNESIDGDTATVEVTIKTYNMSTVLSNFISEYFQQGFALAFSGASEEQLNALASQVLTNQLESAQMDYEKTVPLKMSKVDGKWVVDNLSDQDGFVNVLTGGMIDALENYQKAFNSASND